MVHAVESEWGCFVIPGPYVLDETVGVNSLPVYLIETAAGDSVANTRDKGTAAAIVALPDLLHALQGMLNWARRVKGCNPGPEVVNACNAIAKAGGAS